MHQGFILNAKQCVSLVSLIGTNSNLRSVPSHDEMSSKVDETRMPGTAVV